MKLLVSITQTLGKPFPEVDWISYAKILIGFSLFVTFFLFIFEPFGLSTLQTNNFLISLGFGSMTLLGASAYELSVGQLLKLVGLKANWTFGKWVLNNLGIMLFISLANFMFSRLLIIGFIEWALFPTMLYSTFMIGTMPIVLIGHFLLAKQEKKYQSIAAEINQVKTPQSNDRSQNDVSVFDIPTSKIKYVEALQNYVKIGYVDSDGALKIQTERVTLKGILSKIGDSPVVKCHRSFLVNKEAIVRTEGNAQGLLLSLSECDKIIPVSRACVPTFRS